MSPRIIQRFTVRLLWVVAGLSLGGATQVIAGDAAPATYTKYCAGCHGGAGLGDGVAATFLYPRPRNFKTAEFKFGNHPDDIAETVRNGISGTSMPAFGTVLSAPQITEIVSWITAVGKENAAEPVKMPLEKVPTAIGSVANGKRLYQKVCASCHGNSGRGDGPSAATLIDSQEVPIRPPDFVRGYYKRGGDPASLYKRIFVGLTGSPMPGFGTALSKKEIWDVVAYLTSLRKKGAQVEAHPQAVKMASVPKMPTAKEWQKIPAAQLPTHPLWKRPDWPQDIQVRAAKTSDGAVAIHLQWADTTVDRRLGKVDDFVDAIALMVPNKPGPLPFVGMGDTGDNVRIWLWRALEKTSGTETAFPRVHRDDNPLDKDPRVEPAKVMGNPGTKFATNPAAFIAGGLGTLTFVPAPEHPMSVKAEHSRGVWNAVFETKSFEALGEATTHIAFAVWDGSSGDRNGQKSITQWIRLEGKS